MIFLLITHVTPNKPSTSQFYSYVLNNNKKGLTKPIRQLSKAVERKNLVVQPVFKTGSWRLNPSVAGSIPALSAKEKQ